MVTDSNELLGQTLGTCTLQRLLGRGGMGAVYLARQSRPRRIVAVKVLLPGMVLEQRSRVEFLARFRREADAIAALDHVNIMPVYEYGEQGDLAYLVMPYVTGGTLRDVLEKRGILSLEEVVPIIEQAAAGLDGAHGQSIVHRDLKPGNILFHADGRILLADFGLAKVLKDVTDQENNQGHLTSIGTIVGTPEYLSPEQGTGDTIDYRTDVYSLGVVLYQMLAGRVPFTGTSPVAVAIKHTLEQPPPLTRFNPQVPKNIEEVVMKAMAKSPRDRFNSAGVFAQALRQAVAETLGDGFPSVLPSSQGEHFTPVYPLTLEKTTGIPSERQTGNDEMPTEAMKHPVDNKKDGTNQTPSMSTMLMEDGEDVDSYSKKNEVTPRLSERTQNRLQALPTVITDQGRNDTTFVDNPNHVPMQERSVPQPIHIREQPAQWNTEKPGQQPQIQVYPELQSRNYPDHTTTTKKSRTMLTIGAILILVVILGGLGLVMHAFSGNASQTQGTLNTSGTATSTAVSIRATPTTSATTAGKTNPAYALPDPKAPGAGSLIYGTNYPGTCDPKKGTWANVHIQATCGPEQLRLTNPTSDDAGVILTKLPNGQSLPHSYYIQVQVKLNTTNSQFGIYYHRSSDANYLFMAGNSMWTSSYSKTSDPLAKVAIHGTTLDSLSIVDVIVTGSHFEYYINGVWQGTSDSGYADTDSGGNIGLTVDQGSDVSFQNLAIYTA